MLSMYVIAA